MQTAGWFEQWWRWGTAPDHLNLFLVVLAVVSHACFYLITCVPTFLFPRLFARYKIQKQKPDPTCADFVNVLRLVVVNQLLVEAPLYTLLPVYVRWFDVPYSYESLPGFWDHAWRCAVALVIEDAWHYFAHRSLHHPSVYGRIHKVRSGSCPF
jgi:methylsterol monooxygenase